VDALLPVTQKVAFMREGDSGAAALGSWGRVRAIVGVLMEPTARYPARFRVQSFPSKAELAEIGTEGR
jgi:hypothetical protein